MLLYREGGGGDNEALTPQKRGANDFLATKRKERIEVVKEGVR